MFKIALFLLLLPSVCVPALAQTAASTNDWTKVTALPMGTAVKIRADGKKATCKVEAVDEGGIACKDGATSLRFTRSEVSKVNVRAIGRSAAIGLAVGLGVGAGAGAGIGAGVNSGDQGSLLHVGGGKATGVGAALGALAGGLIGGLVGVYNGYFGAPTVYKR